MKTHALILAGLAALVAAGCNQQNIPDPDPEGDGTMVDTDDSMSSTDSFGESGLGAGEEFNDFEDMDEEMTMVIYFDFDQSELRAEYGDVLQRHANR